MNPYLELARPANCLIASIATLIGCLVSLTYLGIELPLNGLVLAIVTVFLICAGGQAINDVFDAEIDAKINKKKPIPSGRVSKQRATYFAGILFVIGVALAYFINPLAYMIAFAFALLLIIYAALLYKVKYLGNIVVALGTAFTFIYGASVTHEIPLIIILFALSAFFANMSREVTKDFEDKKKDKGFKVTLPMISERAGKIAIVVYHSMAIIVAFWAYFMFNLSVAYFVIVLLSTIVFFNSIKLLAKKNYNKSQKYCKKGMILSLLAYISTIFK